MFFLSFSPHNVKHGLAWVVESHRSPAGIAQQSAYVRKKASPRKQRSTGNSAMQEAQDSAHRSSKAN